MKGLLFAFFFISSASAHLITGTPVLKGALKTKLYVNTVHTTCKVKVIKVKNLLEEDSYGNPAYQVRIQVEVNGKDSKRRLKVNFKREFQMINLFSLGGQTEVRDYEYFSPDGAAMQIDQEGRLQQVQFPYQQQKLTCLF